MRRGHEEIAVVLSVAVMNRLKLWWKKQTTNEKLMYVLIVALLIGIATRWRFVFGEVAETGTRAGADCILIETMSDGYEVKAAVLGAKEHSHLPVFVTMTFDEKGKLLTGGNAASAVALLEGLGVDALGINCGLGPVPPGWKAGSLGCGTAS